MDGNAGGHGQRDTVEVQRPKSEQVLRQRPNQGQAQNGGYNNKNQSQVEFWRLDAVMIDVLNERFTKIRLTMERTTKKGQGANFVRRHAAVQCKEVNGGDQSKGESPL